jgi:hypothetical protein
MELIGFIFWYICKHNYSQNPLHIHSKIFAQIYIKIFDLIQKYILEWKFPSKRILASHFLILYGSFLKCLLHFAPKYSLWCEISKYLLLKEYSLLFLFVLHVNSLFCIDAKQTNKSCFIINIRFEPNIAAHPTLSLLCLPGGILRDQKCQVWSAHN